MSLKSPKTTSASAPAPDFENPDEAGIVADAPAPAPKTTALAAASSRAVAIPGNIHVLDSLKNALPVEFNTLAQVQPTQGQFMDKDKDESLGAEICIELLSFQDNYVATPNADEADVALVKFSDDGVTSKDGVNLQAHLEELRAMGYGNAKITKRVVLVGALLARAKGSDLIDELVQIDLAPSSKGLFDRYMANAAWKIKSGKLDPEVAKRIDLSARVAKNGKNTYTVVDFAASTA